MADFVPIPPENNAKAWELVRPLILKGIERSQGRITEAGLLQKVARGEWQFWIVWEDDDKRADAVVMTDIFKDASGNKVCTVRFLAGNDIKSWIWLTDALELWALQEGCDYVSIWIDKGIARMIAKDLDEYKVTHWMFEKRLRAAKPEGLADGQRHSRRTHDSHTPAV